MFLAFQYPTEIPGVNTNNFLRTSLNSIRKAKGHKDIDAISFLKIVKEKSQRTKYRRKIFIKTFKCWIFRWRKEEERNSSIKKY